MMVWFNLIQLKFIFKYIGEPLPIRKFPLHDDNLPYDRNTSGKINTLFSGTIIKQASSSSIALVLETRSNTEKGQLIQRILFPQEVSFVFHQQLKLVFIILLFFALFVMGFGIYFNNASNSKMTALFYGITLVAQVINPLVPGNYYIYIDKIIIFIIIIFFNQ